MGVLSLKIDVEEQCVFCIPDLVLSIFADFRIWLPGTGKPLLSKEVS